MIYNLIYMIYDILCPIIYIYIYDVLYILYSIYIFI